MVATETVANTHKYIIFFTSMHVMYVCIYLGIYLQTEIKDVGNYKFLFQGW